MTGWFDPAVLPPGADPNQEVTVIVELNEEPAGVTGANAADLAKRQDTTRSSIAGQGGTVIHQFQHALNGFAVRIARSKAAGLTSLSSVKAVKHTRQYQIDNAQSVPFIGAPAAWQGVEGVRGEGIKIATIDTGIDYTHANFGGPGTVAAYTAAHAGEATAADPKLFGPNSNTKVKGGVDLVGDAYDAFSPDPARVMPHPDPNPLDCDGHGSHVAGTAAGFGVTDAGATYQGPYDQTTPSRNFRIGPGVAPRADLYAIRVFGCQGSTTSDVVIAGIDWAVEHKMDVVNMSLGLPFGLGDDDVAEIDATNNATRAGVLVVASAGNDGASPYLVGSPSTASGALSVAAIDSKPSFPGARLGLSTGTTIEALNANASHLPGGALPILVLRDAGGNVSLGCADQDYPSAVSGRLVVSRRGVCDRATRARLAQQHGAAAAAMINTDPGLPPFEGAIVGVTIPLLGIRGVLDDPTSDASTLVAAAGGRTTFSAIQLSNPGFRRLASFTSGGPRFGDSFLKPEVSAPGLGTVSTGVGTGNQGAVISGTSMSSAHVAGLAALVREAHPEPRWDTKELKQAIINTSSPSDVADYAVRLAGAGLVQAAAATRTVAVASGHGDSSSLNFGFQADDRDLHATALLVVGNNGTRDLTFDLSTELAQGSPHSLSFPRTSARVPARGRVAVDVHLDVPIATTGTADAFRDVAGIVKLTPTTPNDNDGIALRVPYYLVPRALANVRDGLRGRFNPAHPEAQVRVTNPGGAIPGTADFYAWGLGDDGPLAGEGQPFEPRAAGVQSFFDPGLGAQVVVFAMNTAARWSNAARYEFDIPLVANGRLLQVIGLDFGLVTTGGFDGRMAAFVFDPLTGALVGDFFAVAPLDGDTILLPVLASRLGLTPAAPRFDYFASITDILSQDTRALPGQASFNAFDNAISTGQFVQVAPGATEFVDVSLNPEEAQVTPARGLMIVSLDNNAKHADQVELISVSMESPGGARSALSDQARQSLTASRSALGNRVPSLGSRR